MDQALGPDSNASFPSLQLVEIELNSDPAGFPLLRALTLPSSSSGLHSTPVNNRKKKSPTGRILLPDVAVAPFASWWQDAHQ